MRVILPSSPMLCREVHCLNAFAPMKVTLLRLPTVFSEVH